jgi:hypothetical protein
MTGTDRSEYIEGLRALADLLDKHPEVKLPYATGVSGDYDPDRVTFYLDTKDDMVAFVKAFPGTLTKDITDSPNYGFKMYGTLRGLHLYAAVDRGEVCTCVVTGTREVVEEVPDPEIITTAQRVRQHAFQALITSTPTSTAVLTADVARLLEAPADAVRPLFAEYVRRLQDLEHFDHTNEAECANSDREADRLDREARAALDELLKVAQ